jgi:outer membrane protein assembly factor BamD
LKRIFIIIGIFSLILIFGCHKNKAPKRAEPIELTSVEELYEKGQTYIKKHRTQTARKYFEQITLREDAKDYGPKAEVAIADSYFAEKNIDSFANAISRYQTFLSFHAMHPLAAYCQYQIGFCYYREVDKPDRDISPAVYSKDAFKKLIENYPNSEYVADAKNKIKELDNVLAAHEVYIGDFYLRSSHPQGAKERYKSVLQMYPDYWNIPLIHLRIAEAANMEGNFDEAREHLNKVIEMSPDSKRAKEATKMMESLGKKEAKIAKKKLESPLKEKKLPDIDKPKENKKRWWMFWRR